MDVVIRNGLCNGEKEFVQERLQKVQRWIQDHGINCGDNELPRVALLGSGGGQRAQTAFLGVLRQLAEDNLLDSILYLAGVSGSTWAMSSMYDDAHWPENANTLVDKALKDMSENRSSPFLDCIEWLNNRNKEGDLSLTDYWDVVVCDIKGVELETRTLAEEAERVIDGATPYPIYSAVERALLDNKEERDLWFEVTPHEAGFSESGAFVETSLLKQPFKEGTVQRDSRRKPMDMVQLQGICGSAFADGKANKEYIRDLISGWFRKHMPFAGTPSHHQGPQPCALQMGPMEQMGLIAKMAQMAPMAPMRPMAPGMNDGLSVRSTAPMEKPREEQLVEEMLLDGKPVVSFYKVVEVGTKRRRPQLIDNLGHRFTIRSSAPSGDVIWRCTVRPVGAACKATVVQRDGVFKAGRQQHNHGAPNLGAVTVAKVRPLAKKEPVSDLSKSTSATVQEVLPQELDSNTPCPAPSKPVNLVVKAKRQRKKRRPDKQLCLQGPCQPLPRPGEPIQEPFFKLLEHFEDMEQCYDDLQELKSALAGFVGSGMHSETLTVLDRDMWNNKTEEEKSEYIQAVLDELDQSVNPPQEEPPMAPMGLMGPTGPGPVGLMGPMGPGPKGGLMAPMGMRGPSWISPWTATKLLFKFGSLSYNWNFGEMPNFLYKFKDDQVPKGMCKEEAMHVIDAGLFLNSPYPPLLGKKRDIDLIISFDFSEGDPFQTVKEAHRYAKICKVPFPEIKLDGANEDHPKSLHIFEEKGKPTVIHIPLFNVDNCKDKASVKREREAYATFQRPYRDMEKIKHLADLGAENAKLNKDVILEEIRKAAERRKMKL